MTTLIIERHGESESNFSEVFTGITDVSLTERGKKQAQLSAEYICDNYKVDAIYSSDLSRAYNTAKALSSLCGLEITTDSELREIDAGEWEKKSFEYLKTKYKDTYSIWLKNIGMAACDGGESVKEMYERVNGALKKIAKQNDGKTVFIVTHATPIRAMQCAWQGEMPEKMKDISYVTNASVSVIKYENEKFIPVMIGYNDHLGDMKTELSGDV